MMNREEAEQRARECGAILSIGDPRDRRYAATTAPREELPDRFDLTSEQSEVMNQGGEPICVACALCSIAESKDFYYPTNLSECWLYKRRSNKGDGMMLRDALKLMQKEGTCTEGCYPLSKRCARKVCTDQWIEAEMDDYRIGTYHRVFNDIPGTLWANRLQIFAAVPVYRTWSSSGEIGMPDGEFLGYHAIEIVGYDLVKKRLKFKNSWGVNWGKDGYGTLPMSYPIPEAWLVKPRKKPGPEPGPKPEPERIVMRCLDIRKSFFGARIELEIVASGAFEMATDRGLLNFRKTIRPGVNHIVVYIPYKFNREIDVTFTFWRGSVGIVKHRKLRVEARLEE